MIIHVPEGLNKPYQGSKGFYLRLGANSQKLKRDKILEFSITENKIRFDEKICPDFNFKDFDDEKFEYYLKLAGITKILDKESFLRNLKVLNEKGMTNAGVLFFAKSPYKYIFSSKIRCVHFRGNERIEILDKKEVDKGIIDIKPGDTYFSVEMKSPKVAEITGQNVGVNVGDNVGVNVGENLSKNQNLILQLLLEDKGLSIEKLAESVGIAARSIERNISLLKEKGLLERVGSDRTGYWKVTPGGAQILRGIK